MQLKLKILSLFAGCFFLTGAAVGQVTLYSPRNMSHLERCQMQAALATQFARTRQQTVPAGYWWRSTTQTTRQWKAPIPRTITDMPSVGQSDYQRSLSVSHRGSRGPHDVQTIFRRSSNRPRRSALKSPADLDFLQVPLSEVVEDLKDVHGVEIALDRWALAEMGIPADVPITVHLKGISLKSALKHMLRPLDLTIVVDDEIDLVAIHAARFRSLT